MCFRLVVFPFVMAYSMLLKSLVCLYIFYQKSRSSLFDIDQTRNSCYVLEYIQVIQEAFKLNMCEIATKNIINISRKPNILTFIYLIAILHLTFSIYILNVIVSCRTDSEKLLEGRERVCIK